ncbi:acyltransferase [Pseudomonas sp. RW407]|uniref:acyltransferase family protein n=1 Tax=Pseudomonas sp. RW407 TaxID=2202894 RepID=UPI000D6F17CE|nr:acyltransferase [Pseudomonas sp. RW407]PWU32068.1 acyltransferase [Pseudomonas sp. RW407]
MSNTRYNLFDPIRHAAALIVLISHHYVLYGFDEPLGSKYFSLGSLAVLVFFSISGYLVTLSFLAANSVQEYAAKRCARIFPALVFCSFLMFYPARYIWGSEQDSLSVFGLGNFLDFLKVSLFAQAKVDSITLGFRFPDSFNGSLWSLKIEFLCYIVLAVVLLLSRKVWIIFLTLLVLAFLTIFFLRDSSQELFWKFAIYCSVMLSFYTGSLFAFARKILLQKHGAVMVIVTGIALTVIFWESSCALVAIPVAICLVVLPVGMSFRDRLVRGRFDISYGLYLYAFPIQQIVINKSSLGFYSSMGVAVAITTFMAIFSWVCIERPILERVRARSRIWDGLSPGSVGTK